MNLFLSGKGAMLLPQARGAARPTLLCRGRNGPHGCLRCPRLPAPRRPRPGAGPGPRDKAGCGEGAAASRPPREEQAAATAGCHGNGYRRAAAAAAVRGRRAQAEAPGKGARRGKLPRGRGARRRDAAPPDPAAAGAAGKAGAVGRLGRGEGTGPEAGLGVTAAAGWPAPLLLTLWGGERGSGKWQLWALPRPSPVFSFLLLRDLISVHQMCEFSAAWVITRYEYVCKISVALTGKSLMRLGFTWSGTLYFLVGMTWDANNVSVTDSQNTNIC